MKPEYWTTAAIVWKIIFKSPLGIVYKINIKVSLNVRI